MSGDPARIESTSTALFHLDSLEPSRYLTRPSASKVGDGPRRVAQW